MLTVYFCRILQFPTFPSDVFLPAITHSASFIAPRLPLFSVLPPVFSLSTNSPNCIALSVSVQLCHPTQTVLSSSVFLLPNLLFVLRYLQRGLVMFFFLRSCFRTSERDQEEIGLRKPAVKGSSCPVCSPDLSATFGNIQT